MDYDELTQLQRKWQNFYITELKGFKDGIINKDDFLDVLERMDKESLMSATYFTNSFERYKRRFINDFSDAILHERRHALVAEKHGLSVIYCAISVSSLLQPFIIDNLPRSGRNWPKTKILNYFKENIEKVDDPSLIDKLILEALK